MKSDAPTGVSILGELGTESGMTPLHLAAYSGNENVVRLLLNSVGVQVEAVTNENVIITWFPTGERSSFSKTLLFVLSCRITILFIWLVLEVT